jgi:hypothetical protein
MTAKTHPQEGARIESELAARLKAAGIRPRFDKVVQQLGSRLKAALAGAVPDGRSVVLTVTAPVKHPSKTAAVLANLFSGRMPNRELRKTIHGNIVRVLPLTGIARYMPKVTVLVHNPDADSGSILAIAKSVLLESPDHHKCLPSTTVTG